MLINTAKFNVVILLVFVGIHRKVGIMAEECYVCGPKADVSCDNFDPTNTLFIKDCPNAKSCSIQTHENFVERSCEDIGVDDCQTANNVQYCYCSKKLCNGKTISFSDDEDLTEGSGMIVITNTIQNEHKPVNTTNCSEDVRFHLYNIFVSIILFLCN